MRLLPKYHWDERKTYKNKSTKNTAVLLSLCKPGTKLILHVYLKEKKSSTQSNMQLSAKDPHHETSSEPQCTQQSRAVSKSQEAAPTLPKSKLRQMSKAERRKLAEAEQLEFEKQEKRERIMKNVKQGAWIAITASLVLLLSVGLIRLM